MTDYRDHHLTKRFFDLSEKFNMGLENRFVDIKFKGLESWSYLPGDVVYRIQPGLDVRALTINTIDEVNRKN
jgi:hypothetical protein